MSLANKPNPQTPLLTKDMTWTRSPTSTAHQSATADSASQPLAHSKPLLLRKEHQVFTITVKPRKGNIRTETFEDKARFVSSVHAYRFSGIDIETSEVVPHYYAYPAPTFTNAPRQKR